MKRLFILLLLVGAWSHVAAAQTPAPAADSLTLTLDDAISRALRESEEIQLARSRAAIAETQVTATRANLLPQVNATAGYTRTLASVFDTGGSFTLPDSLRFDPDPNLPIEERLAYLEDKTPTAGMGALGMLFSDLPFGRENIYTYGFSGSQVLYTGGRLTSAIRLARHAVEAAEHAVTEEQADMELQVRQAYYRALLAQEMVDISEAAVAQAQRFLDEERLRFTAGRASDLEVLRAEVELDNLRPQLVQATNGAEVAMLNLKRLVNLPADRPLRLTTELTPPTPEQVAAAAAPDPRVLLPQRASLRMAEENIAIQRQQVNIARAAYLPNIALQTSYGRQLYPSNLLAFNEDWRTDWTVSLGIQIPIFQGLKRSADVQQAQVGLQQARLQYEQLREGILLEYEQARGERERTLATIAARQRTVEQAQRVYDLTLMRYEKGLATQLEVSNARLMLLSARTNLVQALTDYHIAEASLQRALGTLGTTR